jgi:hypothetical protein
VRGSNGGVLAKSKALNPIPVLFKKREMRQEDHEVEARLEYIVRCFKN